MIIYEGRGIYHVLNLFKWQGSAMYHVVVWALLNGAIALVFNVLIEEGYIRFNSDDNTLFKNNAVWSGITFVVGFLVVFRTSQAYARFWEGCSALHQMHAEWLDTCGSLISFSTYSSQPAETVTDFQNIMVRLFSILHAVSLADIEDSNCGRLDGIQAYHFNCIDAHGLDSHSLNAVRMSESKVELVFMWIQQLMVNHVKSGVLSIPPPLLSRAFQNLANGLVALEAALKISAIPFPFPYAQTTDMLLTLHWLMSPVVVAQWTAAPAWAFILAAIQAFAMWSLNSIAVELENPFGTDANDIDMKGLQEEMNEKLLCFIRAPCQKLPSLRPNAKHLDQARLAVVRESSLYDVWNELSQVQDSQEASTGFFKVARGFKPTGTGDWEDHHHLLKMKPSKMAALQEVCSEIQHVLEHAVAEMPSNIAHLAELAVNSPRAALHRAQTHASGQDHSPQRKVEDHPKRWESEPAPRRWDSEPPVGVVNGEHRPSSATTARTGHQESDFRLEG
eukprot:CAMPEP_0178393718 /NCGR_PEP_ID=MMETSP0689_2-20121128/12331_1 /TAXON_ID=160604 /ORGANISM="Amphidinium massartii, Strain CS-259" /LENGTH=504 /DNA_ID=CAMNT_0020014317 /DNA_START=13 /DNA_END=1523 /DNA_ORIENTATION=-